MVTSTLGHNDERGPCEACHAAEGEQCVPGCPFESPEIDRNAPPERPVEAACFDKFMDRILNEGARRNALLPQRDNPLRERAARHQERPLGRTRIGGRR